jgi:hypothetical protein
VDGVCGNFLSLKKLRACDLFSTCIFCGTSLYSIYGLKLADDLNFELWCLYQIWVSTLVILAVDTLQHAVSRCYSFPMAGCLTRHYVFLYWTMSLLSTRFESTWTMSLNLLSQVGYVIWKGMRRFLWLLGKLLWMWVVPDLGEGTTLRLQSVLYHYFVRLFRV